MPNINYNQCHECKDGFYKPIGPKGELVCDKCELPVFATDVEPDTPMTCQYWEKVRKDMSENGEMALQCAQQGNDELAGYWASQAAHNARYLDQFSQLDVNKPK